MKFETIISNTMKLSIQWLFENIPRVSYILGLVAFWPWISDLQYVAMYRTGGTTRTAQLATRRLSKLWGKTLFEELH